MMKWQVSRQGTAASQLWGSKITLFQPLGHLAPLCYLNRPQGDVPANALPEREGAAGSSREAPGITK